jgi:anti-anti-sigma factor
MNYAIEKRGTAHVVRVQGELVGGNPRFVDAVTNLLTAPGTRILVDLHDVPFLNSTGLGELVRIAAQANIQEGRVILINPSAFVSGVLQTTQLHRFFEIRASVDEALADAN